MAKANRPQQPPTNTPAPSLDIDVETTPAADAGEPPAASPLAESPAETPAPAPERLRQGAQNRPCCPNCSTTELPVLMESVQALPLFTWYACPNRPSTKNPNGTCIYPRVKVPRPEQAEQMQRMRRRRLRESDISAR